MSGKLSPRGESGRRARGIRAALDNYSERRKALFIHELAAEGFIPDEYQFMTNTDSDSFFRIQWVIDTSWLSS